jgi:hypothetical protein
LVNSAKHSLKVHPEVRAIYSVGNGLRQEQAAEPKHEGPRANHLFSTYNLGSKLLLNSTTDFCFWEPVLLSRPRPVTRLALCTADVETETLALFASFVQLLNFPRLTKLAVRREVVFSHSFRPLGKEKEEDVHRRMRD